MNDLTTAAQTWSFIAWHAARTPDEIAIYSNFGERTWSQLADEINALAQTFRSAGLSGDDSLAVLLPNCPEFPVAMIAGLHIGLRVTPVNWHLGSAETAYIIENCEAKALVAHSDFATNAVVVAQSPLLQVKIAVQDTIEGFSSYSEIISDQYEALENPAPGRVMVYTSGTTGNPKGVFRKHPTILNPEGYMNKNSYVAGDMALACGPAYHAAPLVNDVFMPLSCGISVVMRDRFDAEDVLRTIANRKITHMHLVPAMFERLLELPQAIRRSYDVSSVRIISHGAAPCPEKTKHAMIEWFGPVLREYYAASEGGVGIEIESEEWLKKPGSVGKVPFETALRILDDDGQEVAAGTAGKLYMLAPEENRFEYFKAPEKTRDTYIDNYYWLGDIGYIDDDGYLFLTGRTAECIISGGVNIYPVEVDHILLGHAAVKDACTVGIPDDRETNNMGELVHAVVSLHGRYEANDELKEQILSYAREHLSRFKCPGSIDFVDEIPRLPSGKIVRYRVREPFWAGREKSI